MSGDNVRAGRGKAWLRGVEGSRGAEDIYEQHLKCCGR